MRIKMRVAILIFLCGFGMSITSFAAGADKNVVPKVLGDKIMRLPLTRQATNYTCGVAALQSVLAYYGVSIREDNLAKELKTTNDGTSKENIILFARNQGLIAAGRPKMSLDDLRKALSQRKPVMVAIQAWPDTPVDFKADWEDGHWVVALGYNKDNIYFMDPSTLGNYTYIPIPEFLERWHDIDLDNTTKLNHYGIIFSSKCKPSYDPKIILRLE